MTSTSRFRNIRSAHPYRVNIAAAKNLANRFVKTELVSSPRSPPSVFDDIFRLCALHCSTITHVCDHIASPDYPSLNTVHRKLVLLDVNSVVEVINSRLSDIVTHAKRFGFIPKKKKVDLAIDCTDLPYYGDPNTVGVVGGKSKKSTSWFFRFATICIVENGYRFPLGVLPVDQFKASNMTGVVTELLDMASEHVSVRVLLMDRGFHSVKMFRTLKELGVSWLMPAKRTKRVSDAMTEMVESAEGRRSISRRIVVMGDVGVRRRWAEKMGQLRVMIAILQGTWTYQGGESV